MQYCIMHGKKLKEVYLDDREPKAKHIVREIIIWIVEIAIAILAAYFITSFVLEKTTMAGPSMEGTLLEGEKIIINKLAYQLQSPKRFDVIVFQQNGKEHQFYNIKRVIGLPNETIQIIAGEVYIDGEKLEEKFEVERIMNGGIANEEIALDEGEYFVLGDNRNNSEDSRFANVGAIIKEDIIGKAWIRIKPFGFVSTFTPVREPENENQTEEENPSENEEKQSE